MTTKAKVLALALEMDVEVEYESGREWGVTTWKIELMTYDRPYAIEGCHSYVIDSSGADRLEQERGDAKMATGWAEMYRVLRECIAPCTEDCECVYS